MDGKLIRIHPSAEKAAKSVGGKQGNCILKCCRNLQKSAYGFTWKFK